MNAAEAVRLLGVCTLYDSRRPSDAVAKQWAADLAGIDLDEAIAAVREHYTTRPDERIGVGHVIAIVKRHRRARLERAQAWTVEHETLRRVDPDDVGAYLAALRRIRRRIATTPDQPALPAGSDTTGNRAIQEGAA